ncbi:MAG: coproporphyrinogen III oxidase family protein, partial [Clostridia bacterium]|nr:coproporphyrinogen III oxidase family protein [Clostridia bacterium]
MPGIYVHIPFCRQKCTYCDFASYPDEIGKAEAYFACLYKEMRSRAESLKEKTFDTVYFGGGTPSFVDPKYILGCMRLIRERFDLADNAEITLEVNPGTLDRNKYRIYKEAGINRYSIGLQSADDNMLRRLNRIHNRSDFLKAADILKGNDLSVDVMIGLFDQTEKDVENSIDLALAGGANHISVYALTPEEGTPMYGNYLIGDLPDGDTVASLYDFAVSYLKEKGFYRYEVS